MLTLQMCKTCGIDKPLTDFYKATGTKTGYRYECKDCSKANGKARYHAMPAEDKAAKIQRQKYYVAEQKYRLEPEVLDALLSGGCMVCGSYNRLAIDHDHSCCPSDYTCGECIRGVLCYNCNVVEGLLGSDPNRALSLAAYMLQTQNINNGETS